MSHRRHSALVRLLDRGPRAKVPLVPDAERATGPLDQVLRDAERL